MKHVTKAEALRIIEQEVGSISFQWDGYWYLIWRHSGRYYGQIRPDIPRDAHDGVICPGDYLKPDDNLAAIRTEQLAAFKWRGVRIYCEIDLIAKMLRGKAPWYFDAEENP